MPKTRTLSVCFILMRITDDHGTHYPEQISQQNGPQRRLRVTPQNVIIAAKCNTSAKCTNIDAKCNKTFNAKCNNLSTQIVINFLTHNVRTQNVIISEITTSMLFQNRYCGSVISS